MKNVFIVALPRSGTSWLQGMLGFLPEIATVRETHLVDNYLRHLITSWNNEQKTLAPDGLKAILSEAEFYDSLRAFSDRILNKFLDFKPNAEIILEKTPDNLNFVPLLHRLYPQAYFIHVLRDPRAVVASNLALKQEAWGWIGAEQNQVNLALKWNQGIENRDRAQSLLQERFLEVRYENLHRDRGGELVRIASFLGLNYSQEQLEELIPQVSAPDLNRNKADLPTHHPFFDTRANFFRQGKIDGWKLELTIEQILDIEGICLRLMLIHGYQPEHLSLNHPE
jgi:hypothetical protein